MRQPSSRIWEMSAMETPWRSTTGVAFTSVAGETRTPVSRKWSSSDVPSGITLIGAAVVARERRWCSSALMFSLRDKFVATSPFVGD